MDSSCVTEHSASEPKQNGDVHTADELVQVSREEGAPEEGALEAPQITEQPTKKKEEIKPAKSNKKLKEEEKKLKLLFRNFEGLETAEAKMEALGRKHLQLLFEHKSTTTRKDELAMRIEKVIKERDQLQSDFNKASLAKSKLESLCRELQRHSKLVKEDCQLRAQEEETKRKELSEKFQATINDISEQMQENTKANQQLKIENNDLAARLKGLVEQYEVREEHVEKVFKHKQLELQLAEAKMAQQHLRFNEDKEKTLTEKQMLLQQAQEYKKQCEILTKQEKEMRSQLAIYTERFDEFQKTLNKSNEVFGTFKKEMDKMTKTIKKLEKEKNTWKAKCENGNRSLLQMVNEREKHKNEIAALKIKNEKLENLCRALHKGTKGVEKEIDKVEEAAIPDSCSKTPLVKNETTDCEDTRSSVTEQSPQVSEREDSTEKKEFIDAKEEASRSNLNSTELQVLENKLQNESISDPGDKIKQSERAENGTPGVEAVSGESPLECEEIPNDSEESTEPSKEVPNDTCNNSNESGNHLAEVPGEAVDIEAENEDLNIAEIESS